MVNFSSAVLFVTAVTAVRFGKRDVQAVLGNLETINSDTQALTDSINAWDGTLVDALTISDASTALNDAINTANTETAAEAPLNAADSQQVLDFVTGTLSPNVDGALSALQGRQADAAAVGIEGLVLDQVTTLQASTAEFSSTLVGITDASLQGDAQAAADALDASFSTAVTAFS